jgi:uncharacterized protein YbjT (DUF2867 family)
VSGNLADPDGLAPAVADVDAVVFTHASAGGAYADVDYGGVAAAHTGLLIDGGVIAALRAGRWQLTM